MNKVVRALYAILFAIILTAFALIASPARAQTQVSITLDPTNPGVPIPPAFSGLSYEMSLVLPAANGNYFFSPANQSLVAMFRTLGVKSLRVGGNTADRDTIKIPNEQDADRLFAFAKAAGVKVIYTVRMDQGDPQADADIAKYILKHYASDLMCFTIGNEPNHYFTNYASYNDAWKDFATVITSAGNVPNATFCAPSSIPKGVEWAADFAQDHAGDPRIGFISQHLYAAGSGRTATNAVKAQNKLLSADLLKTYENFYDQFAPAALSRGLAYRLEECNSFSNGGAEGTSDAYAAALWGVDYMYWWAQHRASGVNFHTSGYAPGSPSHKPMNYAVFNNSPTGYFARPLGYAMKVFDVGSKGLLLPLDIESTTNNLNLRAYAVLADDKSLYVTLINKEHGSNARDASVTINVGNFYTRSQGMFLTAPNGDAGAKSGITFGGAPITDDGNWNGGWKNLGTQPKGTPFILNLPAATAAVVKLTIR